MTGRSHIHFEVHSFLYNTIGYVDNLYIINPSDSLSPAPYVIDLCIISTISAGSFVENVSSAIDATTLSLILTTRRTRGCYRRLSESQYDFATRVAL